MSISRILLLLLVAPEAVVVVTPAAVTVMVGKGEGRKRGNGSKHMIWVLKSSYFYNESKVVFGNDEFISIA